MVTTESDRLLALGATIEVVDGQLPVRFSMQALKRCEDRYGNLQALVGEMHWLTGQALTGWPEPIADRLSDLLVTVTGDPRGADALSGPAMCVEALLVAWDQAFPVPDEGKAEGATQAPPSRGPTGGGSPSSTAT